MCGHISFSHLVSRSCIHCCLARECSVHAVVAVYISLLHTQLDRSLLARSLARSLTRTQALRAAAALSHLAGSLALHITQSGGTLTSRWLSRSSHHAGSLARSFALRHSEQRHSHISLALSLFTSHFACFLARSLSRVCAGLAPVCHVVPARVSLPCVCRERDLPCVGRVTTASI